MGQGVSQIKAATDHLSETYVMRMRVKEFVVDARLPQGRWAISKGHVFPATPAEDAGMQEVIGLRVGTWNTWFDQGGDCEARWSGLYDITLSEEEGERLDVLALQEVIARSFKLLLEREDARRDWLIVDFEDVLQRTQCWYGTTILVRKSWMVKSGLDRIEAALVRYGSPMARSLLAVELGNENGVALRIGTSHFESGPTDTAHRQRQFHTAARLLSYPSSYSLVEQAPPSFSPSVDDFIASLPTFHRPPGVPPSILCGDTNIYALAELAPLTTAPLSYVDLYNAVHPCPEGERYETDPTFFTTYRIPGNDSLAAKRIDFVLAHDGGGGGRVEVKGARRVGDEPLKGKDGEELVDGRGRDGKMFASDHLGVVVEVEVGLLKAE